MIKTTSFIMERIGSRGNFAFLRPEFIGYLITRFVLVLVNNMLRSGGGVVVGRLNDGGGEEEGGGDDYFEHEGRGNCHDGVDF